MTAIPSEGASPGPSRVLSLLGRFGGFVAIAVCGAFWLFVWLEHRFPAHGAGTLVGVLYLPYVALLLSVPIVGLAARHNVKRAVQSQGSGLWQVALALAAMAIAYFTFAQRFVELP